MKSNISKKKRGSKKGQKAHLRGQKRILKIVALIFASTIWFYVLNSEPYEVEKEIPISFITTPGQAVANLTPRTLKVRLKGSRVFMQNIFSSSERVVLNLRESQYQGLSEFEALVQNTDVPLPFGVEVLELEPKIIPIRLDREIRKEVEVRAQLSGDLPTDLRLVEQEVSPSPVMIKGPVEVMRRIGVLRTEPINRATLEGSGSIPVGINDLDSRVSIEGLEEDGFQFSYSVKAQTANLTVKNVKIRFLATRQNFSSEIKEAAIDVLAPEGRKLRASEVQVIADIPEKTAGTKVSVKLRAELPEGVHLLQIHPEEINVKLQ